MLFPVDLCEHMCTIILDTTHKGTEISGDFACLRQNVFQIGSWTICPDNGILFILPQLGVLISGALKTQVFFCSSFSFVLSEENQIGFNNYQSEPSYFNCDFRNLASVIIETD